MKTMKSKSVDLICLVGDPVWVIHEGKLTKFNVICIKMYKDYPKGVITTYSAVYSHNHRFARYIFTKEDINHTVFLEELEVK